MGEVESRCATSSTSSSRAVSGQLARRNARTDGEIEARGDGRRRSPESGGISRIEGGAPVRLGELFTIGEKSIQSEIRRRHQQYERLVTFDYRGPSRVGNDFVKAFLDGTEFPAGYTIEEGRGVFLNRKDETQILLGIALALVLIYMVTAALFESLPSRSPRS
jgi:multidrug efflux pump subunit AcrB